jgi:antitoxin component of RelBE/YafQ-DinJ toxin-antitoxin module
MATTDTRLIVRVPASLKQDLEALAETDNVDLSNLVRLILTRHVRAVKLAAKAPV